MSETPLYGPVFDGSPIGVAVLGADGAIIEANPAFARLLGRSPMSLRTYRLRDLTHPDDVSRDEELLAQLADGGLPYFQAQTRLVHRTGDAVWTRLSVSPVAEPGGPARFVAHIEDVTEVRRAKDLLERRALYDHLTGLANRTLLLEQLGAALELRGGDTTTVACIFLDVDHFKLVNDSLGHEAGDTLLQEIARRIRVAVRPGDLVARFGGDEFVVVLEAAASVAAAEALVTVIAAEVQAPVVVSGHEVVPTVSAGLAFAEPGVTPETLVRNADTAMHAAKRRGRARVEVFSPDLRHHALTKLSIESELRTAIREGELVVHYQPIVRLDTRETVAFEALVRWQHPNRGLLMPEEFIEVCEEANLVVPLGAFVIMETCELLAAHPEFPGRIYVNVSTRQIGSADLTRVVMHALETTGVDPSRLGLEITESGMLIATQAARTDLDGLTRLGVDLVIDDFGTGYSSLSSVLLNPVAGLKLAREFTLRLGDRSTGDRISGTVAQLTSNLDLYGVIEGIESEAQRAMAIEHGWTHGQGFLFGHGVPAERLAFSPDGHVSLTDDEHGTIPSAG
ncbi:putative bifunctional diguanylate cyclase/phosphodiesterase [Demequina lignilytica]|uniref:EAL domain-containing protein n=1 Tax=Demequina lignilytica TaxID=3051663 RepID=A0AAW7M7L7_9MICO|nr:MULTISPECIES: EAL domain-containing protein [unclassified Demequina]MDN4478458.1 EAL domain-containing protein [Demequina sp. SYSU T00039-1]MDN4482384.1 EAL domain-containing protein [Demequina sp. SYSU T0a273]MDN4487035.1 EAL domain-containing protein [Demequina sp. SYSU T00039]MDN4489746.1 EAL domain-containing protein [Demequina sp. SYSU T00068]